MGIEVVILAFLSSPVIIATIQQFSQRKEIKILQQMLQEHKINSAIKGLRQKNWKLIESGTTRRYSNQEFYLLYNELKSVLPEDEWDDILKEETRLAIKILRGEKE